MKIGYARVSSNTQDLELQKQALNKAGCEKIYSESISGKDNNRTELAAMLKDIRVGDIVVVYKIDRIARSLKGLIEIIELLNSKKVDLVSLDSGDKVDTTSPMGKAFFQIAGVFAELERGMINARTKAGIEKAKADGVKFGRVPGSKDKSTAGKIDKIKIFLAAGKSYDWIARELHVSKNTIASAKKNGAGNTIPTNKRLPQSVEEATTNKTIKVLLHLVVENNSQWVRGKKKTYEDIEMFTLPYYNFEKTKNNHEYILTIEYENDEDLEKQIDDLYSELFSAADSRHCFIDDTRISTLDNEKYWY